MGDEKRDTIYMLKRTVAADLGYIREQIPLTIIGSNIVDDDNFIINCTDFFVKMYSELGGCYNVCAIVKSLISS